MGVSSRNSSSRTKEWESVSPTQGNHAKSMGVHIPTLGATPKCGSVCPQLEGLDQIVRVRIANSRGQTDVWESASPSQGAPQKSGSPYPVLKGTTPKAWEFVSSSQGATPKCGSRYPELKRPHESVGVHIPISRGPHQSVGVRIPNSTGHGKGVGVRIPVLTGHTKGGSPYPKLKWRRQQSGNRYPQLKGPHQGVGVGIPHSSGRTKVWESASPT